MTERGALLGNRYELEDVIGRGGMAEVWRAKDNRLGRQVAVKRLRVDLASDQTFQARFRREAQAAAGLNHPNIVSVYDTGEEIDPKSDIHVPYIVMELVEGITLRDVLRDGRKILPERALEFTQGILDALAYSHRAGIVHRDIKPANVMLTNSGTVKVMDFGIARAVADTSATMTQTAAVIGTAQYLSPEQARGEKVDNRSDIYSTGVLLYELLVGRPPFVGDSPVSVAYQHVRETPVAPSTLDPEITPAMDAIVLKALSKDPAERYPNAKAMRDDITRALENEPVTAVVPRPAPVAVPAAAAATTVMSASSDAATTTTVGARRGIDPEPEQKRKPSVVTIVLSSLAIALLAAVVVGVYLLMQNPKPTVEMVTVPSVVTFNQVAATSTLKGLGLEVTVARANSDKPKDEVVSQDPLPNQQVPKGSTVTITVSDGPLEKTIPPLTGMTFDEAKAALQTAGFTGEITRKDADPKTEPIDAKKDSVVTSEPASGVALDPAKPVVLVIATGKSIVPNLIGKTPEEAVALARAAGFSILPEEVETSQAQPGRIFQQSVNDGTAALRSDVIRVQVAKAPAAIPPPTSPPPNTPTPSASPGG